MKGFFIFVLVFVLTEIDAVDDSKKFDCLPEDNATEKECLKRGCLWEKKQQVTIIQRNNIIYRFFNPSCLHNIKT